MTQRSTIIVVLLALAMPLHGEAGQPLAGQWRAWLDSPGGQLPFMLELAKEASGWRAWVINGDERIDIPSVSYVGKSLVLDIDHYDSRISATLSEDGQKLDGKWRKRAARGGWTEMRFHAVRGLTRRFLIDDTPTGRERSVEKDRRFDGRWRVKFSSEDQPAVAVFESRNNGTAIGTFLTTTGDYRFLAGNIDGDRLRLSCFDGAHAFLFDATLQTGGGLAGDFWSRDTWHESWTAERDDRAELSDGFRLTRWVSSVPLGDLAFPDLTGTQRRLDDASFAGKARIIEVFGSWCPNCHDAARYLAALDRRYRDRGLSIVGLAFELTGDFSRDAAQVRKFAARCGADYPMLIAGESDKKKASAVFPVLDRVRAYPTIIFLDSDDKVRAIHTGFSGPATGDAHRKLKQRFERIIEELLSADSKAE